MHDFNMEKILSDIKNSNKKNFVLDTDTFNEIDDQYAVTYALYADDINVLAMTAAPFTNCRSTGPEDGMEKSYQELLRLKNFIDPENKMNVPAFRGSRGYLENMQTPRDSEAAREIIRLAHEAKDILYVAMTGCFTNVASALLLDPSIKSKIVVIMLGANSFAHTYCNEFNLKQDRAAARVIFECGVPLVVLPVMGVTEVLKAAGGEIAWYLKDKTGPIGNYLLELFEGDEGKINQGNVCRSVLRTIWDIGAIAFMRDPEKFCHAEIVPARSIDDSGKWRDLNDGRKMIYVDRFFRDEVFSDLFTLIVNKTK